MSFRRSFLALASFLAIAGCDDAATPPKLPPTLDTGVPDSTGLQSASDAEAQAFCRGWEAYINALVGADVQKRIRCVATGTAAAAAGSASCQSTYSTCMKETSDTGTPADFSCDTWDANALASCAATIGQLEACANALAADVDPLLDGFDCSVATDPNAFETYVSTINAAAEGRTVEECTALPLGCLSLGYPIELAVGD